MTTYNSLIIEDHPLIVDAYKRAFAEVKTQAEDINFNITTVDNCDDALAKIEEAQTGTPIDLAFLDIKLPPSKDGKIISGEDLGVVLRKKLPKTKIIIATTYSDNFRINSIFKYINPEGFLVKNDLNPQELITAIQTILGGAPHYSKSVIELMRKRVSHEIVLDEYDRKLLYELSMGSKMSELPDVIPLSIGAIEKRKRSLKEAFGVLDKNDKALLKAAQEMGFI